MFGQLTADIQACIIACIRYSLHWQPAFRHVQVIRSRSTKRTYAIVRLLQIARSDERNCGHKYKLYLPISCSSSARQNISTYHAAKMWNDSQADSTDFSNLNNFKRSLNSKSSV